MNLHTSSMFEAGEILPSPTAYPRQERKKSHWLSQLPLSVPSSSLSMSALDSASVMVLESLLPSPFPMFAASLCCLSNCQACVRVTTGRKPVGNYLPTWYASGVKSDQLVNCCRAARILAMRRVRSPSCCFGAISIAHVAVALRGRPAISHLLG